MASYEVFGVMSKAAKAKQNAMYGSGASFKVSKFTVTDQGHDPDNFTAPLTPDPSQTCTDPEECGATLALQDITLPVTYSDPGNCPIFQCDLPAGTGTGVVSQILLYAEIACIPDGAGIDDQVGDTFLFGIANFGAKTKGDLDEMSFKVGVFG